MDWFLYILRCQDNSLYAGITTDVERRLKEHNQGPKGARYTRARRPVTLLISWPYPNRSVATKAEIQFKKFSRKKKQSYIELQMPPL
jgi:putative endonuclease